MTAVIGDEKRNTCDTDLISNNLLVNRLMK